MTKAQEVLESFIGDELKKTSLDLDERSLKAFASLVGLEKGDSREEDETRTVYLEEDTDGQVSAKSIKMYNIMKVSFHDLTGLLLAETTLLFSKDEKIAALFALLTLIHQFYPKLTVSFNDTDAKLLLAIYQLGRKEVTASEVEAAFHGEFGESLPISQIERSLRYFTELRVLKYLGDGKYETRERMTYERK